VLCALSAGIDSRLVLVPVKDRDFYFIYSAGKTENTENMYNVHCIQQAKKGNDNAD
jgi:hypothetical protein